MFDAQIYKIFIKDPGEFGSPGSLLFTLLYQDLYPISISPEGSPDGEAITDFSGKP